MREKAIADAEYAVVIALPAPQRYAYFLKQIADWEAVWSLHAPDGWVLSGAADAQVLVPVWPHARYAAACAAGAWQGSTPQVVDLGAWMHTWLPGIARDERRVAVFSVPDGPGIIITAEQLLDDIQAALADYD